jgi:hypothetical protein
MEWKIVSVSACGMALMEKGTQKGKTWHSRLWAPDLPDLC